MSETILQVKNLKKYYMVGRKGLLDRKSTRLNSSHI